MKKKVALALVAVLLLASFTACGGGDTDPGDNGGEEKVFHAMMFSEPDSLDPFISSSLETRGVFMENVHNGLVGYNSGGEMNNSRIAESWEISDDGLVYTFKIKEGATFHDSSVLDADDVKFTFDKYSGLDGGNGHANFNNIVAVEKLDALTVAITLDAPNSSFLSYCAYYPIVPAEDYNLVTDPIGCGPFKLSEYVEGQKLVYEKFEGYIGDAKPYFDKVEIRIMGDSNSVVMALMSEDLDFAQIMGSDIASLSKTDVVIEEGGKNTVEQFSLNWKVEPFNNPLVRQAIAHAIDRSAIIETAMAGHADEVYGPICPSVAAWYNPDIVKYEYDPEKAKALLKEAGYENLEFTIKCTGTFPEDVNTATAIAAQMAEIGVTAHIQKIEWPTWMDEVYIKHDYEATTIGMPGELDPDATLIYWQSGYEGNFDEYSNARVDELLQQAKRISDTTSRKALYDEVQMIMTQEIAKYDIMETKRIVARAPELKGYVNYPTYYINYAEMYYED